MTTDYEAEDILDVLAGKEGITFVLALNKWQYDYHCRIHRPRLNPKLTRPIFTSTYFSIEHLAGYRFRAIDKVIIVGQAGEGRYFQHAINRLKLMGWKGA